MFLFISPHSHQMNPIQNTIYKLMTDSGEKTPLLKSGPVSSNPRDGRYSPAPTSISNSDSLTSSNHFKQIRGTKLPHKDYDVC